MPDFLINSPEVQEWISDSNTRTRLNNARKSTVTVVPGGLDAVRGVVNKYPGLGNTLIDILGGVGQYKAPQRLGAALLGGAALGSDEQPISAAGAVGGYGFGAGLEEVIRRLRNAEMSKSMSDIEASGALTDLNASGFMGKIDDVGEALKNNDLTEALTTNEELLEGGARPFGATVSKSHANGINQAKAYVGTQLLDDAALASLRENAPGEIKKFRDIPGFSKREYSNQIKSLIDYLQSQTNDYSTVGINNESLARSNVSKSMKVHELSELLHMADPSLSKRLPMEGGNFGSLVSGETGLRSVGAAHQSPAVLLQESDINARLLSPEGKQIRDKLRAMTGEKQFIEKILGTNLDDVVLGNNYVSENADDIARILNTFKANKMPPKELLDKVRVNLVTSILGRAGRGLSNLEHSMATMLRTLLKRR